MPIIMANEESYTQRRMLFKDIWETAMNINEKDDIMTKPKVIKTLRLGEVDKCVVGKTKKQRIKNLRHVCNRILDFCDRQDADDVFYEQFAVAGGHEREPTQAHKIDGKSDKKKTHKIKRKIKKAKSMFGSTEVPTIMKATTSELKGSTVKLTGILSPAPGKKSTLKAKQIETPKPNPEKFSEAIEENTTNDAEFMTRASVSRRKTVKKNHSKRKKRSTDSAVQELGILMKSGTRARARTKTNSPKLLVTKL